MEKTVLDYNSAVEGLSKGSAVSRLEMLFDDAKFTELGRFAKNGENSSGVVAGFGYVNGMGVYAYSQDKDVLSGAMNKVQANKILSIYELAAKNGCPIVAVFDSAGALYSEGIDALNAYGKLIKASNNISGVVPQISVVMGSCVGQAAILAAQADITLMLSSAEYCNKSKFITGDENVGTAKVCAENGLVSFVGETEEEVMAKLRDILAFLPENNLSMPLVADYVPANITECPISKLVDNESFLELSENYGKCAHTGFARVGGKAIGLVITDPRVNEGRLCSFGATKIARFVRLCDAYSLPIVTLLNSAGFMGSSEEEISGDVKSVAMLTHSYAEATTAKITVITGKAYSEAFTSMAGEAADCDAVIAWDNAEISALEPMTAVQLMYKDRLGEESREDLEKEYKASVASPILAAQNGFIDDVIKPEDTAKTVIELLEMLSSKRVSTLDKKHSLIQL